MLQNMTFHQYRSGQEVLLEMASVETATPERGGVILNVAFKRSPASDK